VSAQHTPGPWRVEVRPTNVKVLHEARGKGDGYNNRVAECHHWSPATGPQTSPMEAEANARLIASAPDLLEALEDLKHRAWNVYQASEVGDMDFENAVGKANAAISKAAGQCPMCHSELINGSLCPSCKEAVA
jgi:hypothetical protein